MSRIAVKLKPATGPCFARALSAHGLGPLRRDRLRELQINVGRLCNQACNHCHVDAGPKR
ncbi:MAG: radical SAM protein, partial [Pseudomonadota bacterium]